jgi:predicted nucleotidyltransferase
MFPVDVLDYVLSPESALRVVRAMVNDPATELTGRGIARRARVSPPQAVVVLKRLESLGLVARRGVGRADVWRLRREHVLVPVLVELFRSEREMTTRLKDELRDELRRLGVTQAFVFGSAARGEADVDSDLDIYVEVPDREEARRLRETIGEVQVRLLGRYSTMVSPLIYSKAEARRPPNPGLLRSIRREGVPLLEEG